MNLPDHMTASDKTRAIIVLAEALQAATLVGQPAPRVARLGNWMQGPLRRGDLVIEMSTKHRGPNPRRAGVLLKISRHRSPYARVTEILLLDSPCGKPDCRDQKCIHRQRWSDAEFVRIPVTPEQLAEALGGAGGAVGRSVGRDDILTFLADAGFSLRDPNGGTPDVRDPSIGTPGERDPSIGTPDVRDPSIGTPGMRDPEHPCTDYDPAPGGPGRCDGDAHYLCEGCKQPSAPPRKEPKE